MTEIDQLRLELERERALRLAERAGRTKAEQALREAKFKVGISSNGGILIPPMAIVTTPFPNRFGTPRQPLLVDSLSIIKFHPDLQATFNDLVYTLNQYSHIWLIYYFHQNTNLFKANHSTLRTKNLYNDNLRTNDSIFIHRAFESCPRLILPPRKKDGPVGVLACRSPHRPNPIGLSVVRLKHIDYEKRVLVVSGLDAIDGTPIIDIKPYIPQVECINDASTPSWVQQSYSQPDFDVELSPQVLDFISEHIEKHPLPYPYDSTGKDALIKGLKQILSADIRSRHTAKSDDKEFVLVYGGFSFRYTISERKTVLIIKVAMEEGKGA